MLKKYMLIMVILLMFSSLTIFAQNEEEKQETVKYQFYVSFPMKDLADKAFKDGIYHSDYRYYVFSLNNDKVVDTNANSYEPATKEIIEFISGGKIIQLFTDAGIQYTSSSNFIDIIYCPELVDGYIALAKGKDETYFSPILINGEKYGAFENKKVYSKNEFLNLCKVDGELIVNEEKVECDVKPLFVYGEPCIPLRALLESIGTDVQWDEENRVASCDGFKLKMDTGEKKKRYLIHSDGETHPIICEIVNGRILVDEYCVSILSNELGFSFSYNNDSYTIGINT
ncbi:MAG: hypothetical protein E7600_03230 [Ruminococcaceae bacterium]|nr:hypothetical protein [Oscillospiraceae bacterium]